VTGEPPTSGRGQLRGIARRLSFTLAAIVLAFGAASFLALYGLIEVHDALHQSTEHAAGVNTAQALASAVRDQYAHQAHTIVLGNDSHLGFYEGARQQVSRLVEAARRHAQDREERAWLLQIERESQELDQLFKERIVPAVLARDEERITKLHDEAQRLVSSIQDRADRLAKRLATAAAASEERAHVAEHAVLNWSAAILCCATLLAAGLGLWLHRSVVGPVRALAAGTARIAAGELDTPIGLSGDDELAELGRRFDAMTKSLRDHQRQLVEHERLAGIGRLAAGVAHEINNPLTVILGYARLLEKKANPEQQADLRVIGDETRRCQEIVEGLLDLSRPLTPGSDPVPLRPLLEEVATRLGESGLLPAGHLQIEGEGAASAHEGKLRQVLFNLLKNAAEAAGPTGQVKTRIEAGPAQVVLEIEDSGPGLPPGSEGHLFEPFYTTKAQGTGLGLAVSKAIVLAHGGELVVARARPGAIFRLSLPKEVPGA
jgi:two-component system NtrC family sensor kinase